MQLFAQELGGNYENFVQGQGFAALSADLKDGFCAGASVTWLKMLRIGMNLTTEIKQNQKATLAWISKIQRIENYLSKPKGAPSTPVAQMTSILPPDLETILANASFRKAGTALPPFPWDGVARYMYQHGTRTSGHPGYYLIVVTHHAMAGFVDSNGLQFFDPNGGVAQFRTYDAFELFVCRYLCHKDVMALYNLDLLKPSVAVFRLE
jgi:hypothetical protein